MHEYPGIFYSHCILMLSSLAGSPPPLFIPVTVQPFCVNYESLPLDSCKLCCDMVTCDISLISHLGCDMHADLFPCKTPLLQVHLTGIAKSEATECTNSFRYRYNKRGGRIKDSRKRSLRRAELQFHLVCMRCCLTWEGGGEGAQV